MLAYEDINIAHDKIVGYVNDAYEVMRLMEAVKSAEPPVLPDVASHSNTYHSSALDVMLGAPLRERPKSNAMKKLFALGTIAGMDEQQMRSIPAVQTAANIDDGITRVKALYQVGKGIIDEPERAVDVMIDHAAARAAAVLPNMVEQGLQYGAPAIAGFITSLIPGMQSAAPYVSAAIFCAAPKVANYSKNAIPKVARVAKAAGRSIVHGMKAAGRTIVRGLKSLFS